MENKNEFTVRQLLESELKLLNESLDLFSGVTDLACDEIKANDAGIALVITGESISDEGAEFINPAVRDILAIGKIYILSSEEEVLRHGAKNLYGTVIPAGKSVLYFSGLFVPDDEAALSSLWAMVLYLGLKKQVSVIFAWEDTDFAQPIQGQQQWWLGEEDDLVANRPAEGESTIGIKLVPFESFFSALEALEGQGVSIPRGTEDVLALFK